MTGWKIGWVYGSPDLVQAVLAHQSVTFSVHHPSQEAIAYALNLPDSYFEIFQTKYEKKRQLILTALGGSGLKAIYQKVRIS